MHRSDAPCMAESVYTRASMPPLFFLEPSAQIIGALYSDPPPFDNAASAAPPRPERWQHRPSVAGHSSTSSLHLASRRRTLEARHSSKIHGAGIMLWGKLHRATPLSAPLPSLAAGGTVSGVAGGTKKAEDSPQDVPRWPQEGPKMAQGGRQDGPVMAQAGSKCDRSKPSSVTVCSGFVAGPRMPKLPPKMAERLQELN